MSYEECYDKNMDKIMKEFKNGKLKMQNNMIVQDRKQAIAIAINMSMSQCMNSTEMKKIEKKVMSFLLHDERKISETRIPLTNVIETRILIKKYLKKNKSKALKLENLLVRRITKAAITGIKISMNIWEELHMIQKMFNKK